MYHVSLSLFLGNEMKEAFSDLEQERQVEARQCEQQILGQHNLLIE